MADDGVRATSADEPMIEAVRLARRNAEAGASPFGAVLVRDGEVLAAAANEVASTCDPSAHAEMQAIRAACRRLGTTDLAGSVMYASGYPCAMCRAAMKVAGIGRVWFACSNEDGATYGLSVDAGYLPFDAARRDPSMPMDAMPVAGALDAYRIWRQRGGY